MINSIPANPTPPTATLTQPTCVVSTGTILFTAPIGADLSYSIDGGVSYQASTLFAAVAANGTYLALVKNSVTGCVSSISLLTINLTIPLPATPIAFGNNACSGESISLSTSAVAGATYRWSGPNGFVSSIQNPVIANATAEMSGTYTLVVYLTPNCPSLPGSVSIVVNPLPTPMLQNGHICIDSVTNTVINLYVLDAILGDSAYTYEWFLISGATYTPITGANLSTYAVDTAGFYGVRATSNTTGCASDIVTATVILSPTPNKIDVIVSEYFSDEQTITVNVFPTGDYQYQMDNGAPQSANVFMNVASGAHQIVIKSECGTFDKEVIIMDYPKYFTPNGDGYNETWNIFDLNTQANAKIYIFDRFGKLLKEISPSGTGWDGTYNQNSLPSTDYWFIVHYAENNMDKVFKSHFALKR